MEIWILRLPISRVFFGLKINQPNRIKYHKM
jgi:hypothetical protein